MLACADTTSGVAGKRTLQLNTGGGLSSKIDKGHFRQDAVKCASLEF